MTRRLRIVPWMRRPVLLALATFALAGCGAALPGSMASSGGSQPPVSAGSVSGTTAVPATSPESAHPVTAHMFAFYYLWWDLQHWKARLGPSYPFGGQSNPLPARLAPDGCGPVSLYPGNQLTDVSTPLYNQADPAQIATDVKEAAAAGLSGFAVAWAGTGTAGQTAASSTFNSRLDMLVKAVDSFDAAGGHFKLWISYMSSSRIRTQQAMLNDFAYLYGAYAGNRAFDLSNGGRMTLIVMGSRKYPLGVLQQLSAAWRSRFYLVGDENWRTWDSARAAVFDADQYYWSSEPPVATSYAELAKLATMVRSEKNPDGSAKQFFSPLAPGYDKQLAGGSNCVPRAGGSTMEALFAGNSAAHPDAWLVISWNEITEGTYILPLERYGNRAWTP